MSEEIKKEAQDVELNQDELEPVAGGCSEESRFIVNDINKFTLK